ncbi:MAG: DUF1934 domain-containing protein [Ruminococcaceae bacterium]|nr:DUF1934 domain-containing protein [Oscillospiraceae bacterium]
MKIPVDIHVRSERLCTDLSRRGQENPRPEIDDFNISGTMKKQKDGLRIEYTEDDGLISTLVHIFPDKTVSVHRMGLLNSHMTFAHEKSFTCICNTGFMPLQIRVNTKRMTNTVSMEGGKLDIEFSVEVVGNLAERNRLTLSVSPDKSIIKS